MGVPTEAGVYSGTAGVTRNTLLLTHMMEDFSREFPLAVLNQTPVLKALGALGDVLKEIKGGDFGNGTATGGRGIVRSDASFQFSGALIKSTPSGGHVGVLGNINPQYIDPMDGWAYAWKRLVYAMYVPEEVVKDNQGRNRLKSVLDTQLRVAQAQAATDLNYIFLGNASAPASSPYGLPYLISVTQSSTTAVGGIDPTSNTYWQNQTISGATGVGGGGELDRPLALLRQMDALDLKVNGLVGSSNDKLKIATKGLFMYYKRAGYADTIAQGVAGLRNAKMYDAQVDHLIHNGNPLIYDPAVTVPVGTTASTECMYSFDLNAGGLAVRNDEFFLLEPWEAPRAHDRQRYYQANIWIRYTPFASNRRVLGVLYNVPANPDAAL